MFRQYLFIKLSDFSAISIVRAGGKYPFWALRMGGWSVVEDRLSSDLNARSSCSAFRSEVRNVASLRGDGVLACEGRTGLDECANQPRLFLSKGTQGSASAR